MADAAVSRTKPVFLPKTDFPMKGELPKREPELLARWEKETLYAKLLEKRKDEPLFVLHDGPPYANGHIHIGHALNKILKDMVVKSRAMEGYRAPFVPGWDCHGLPIEQALLKELKLDKRQVTDVADFRKRARAFAERFIDIQRAEFKRLGVLGDWDHPYLTLSPRYESAILKVFRLLFEKGFIYRGKKPIYWCPHDETALAEAEVEYKDKKSPSIYVEFRVKSGSPFGSEPHAALIWTTTPWTLPANVALAFNPEFEYVLVDFEFADDDEPRRLIVARARLEALVAELGASAHKVLKSAKGGDFEGMIALSPLGFRDSRGVLGAHVSSEDGTGIVHTAPGHGADDYEVGRRYHLPIVSPVDAGGKFTEEAGEFKGLFIEKGNKAVIEALQKAGRLLRAHEITHSYPHCWRCKNPVIFRATEQWFLRVDQAGLRQRLQAEIDKAQWIPEAGRARISSMVQNRPDWCISRQRVWGTPIPVLYCENCGKEQVFEAVEEKTAREGAEFWFTQKPSEFLPAATACAGCKGTDFRKEQDILDVWVDSGASWLGVLGPGEYPAHMYLEGSDQHRGWFQSSLVLSTAIEGKAPFKQVLTHGFVLDDQGRAMHKSLGNVVSPQEVIEKWGADVLRLWVALSDYSDDVRLSPSLMAGPADTYRKLRNTLRYLLGNTSDFDPEKHAVAPARMPEVDRYLLHRLSELVAEVRDAYDKYRFRAAAKAISDFCILDLSSFYLDALKDRLYTLAGDSPERRSGQTVQFETLHILLRLLAPILSMTAEEAWTVLGRQLAAAGSSRRLADSILLSELPLVPSDWRDPELAGRWKRLLGWRETANRLLEARRAAGDIGKSLDAQVRFTAVEPSAYDALTKIGASAVAEAFNVSAADIRFDPKAEADPGSDVLVSVEKAGGAKCARCWRWTADVGKDPAWPQFCLRCAQA